MNDYLNELVLEDLQGEQRELAECIGMEAYIKLVRRFAGSLVYVSMPQRISIHKRNEEIIDNFDGHNYKELAIKYHLCEMSIRRIITAYVPKQIEGQIQF